MFTKKLVFAQLMQWVPHYHFHRVVRRYKGNYKVSSFTCWDQFLCMAFAQLTYRESLRDIEACLNSRPNLLYHLEQFNVAIRHSDVGGTIQVVVVWRGRVHKLLRGGNAGLFQHRDEQLRFDHRAGEE